MSSTHLKMRLSSCPRLCSTHGVLVWFTPGETRPYAPCSHAFAQRSSTHCISIGPMRTHFTGSLVSRWLRCRVVFQHDARVQRQGRLVDAHVTAQGLHRCVSPSFTRRSAKHTCTHKHTHIHTHTHTHTHTHSYARTTYAGLAPPPPQACAGNVTYYMSATNCVDMSMGPRPATISTELSSVCSDFPIQASQGGSFLQRHLEHNTCAIAQRDEFVVAFVCHGL